MELFVILASIGAVVSAVVAITANGHAARSADAAVGSARAADDSATQARRSADAAESTVELGRSERDRATERSDVEWSVRIESDDGSVTYTNVGSTAAYDVSAVVRVHGTRHDIEVGDVPSDHSFTCDASADFSRKAADDKQWWNDIKNSSFIGLPPSIVIEARITWQSEHGSPFVVVIKDAGEDDD